MAYQVRPLLLLPALVVEGDQVGGQPAVELLVLGVQHQENQVKPVEGVLQFMVAPRV